MSILRTPICRVWEGDMAEAREAFQQGDIAWGHRCLRRAATARRWISEDLRAIRRAVEAAAELAAARAEMTKLNRRLFRMKARHDAQRDAIHQRIAHIRSTFIHVT
jgi:hypothetical protein